MKTLKLAVVCPTSGLPQNTEQARREVWAEVTRLLQPDLGKLFSSFYPVSTAWGVELNEPYGVVMGKDDPVRFMRIAVAATEVQNNAIDFHTGALLEKADMEKIFPVGDTLFCPVFVDGSDQEVTSHSIWHMGLAAGAVLPDCGIYFMEQRRAVASPEMVNAIAGNLANYAVCVVQMEVPV